MKTDNTVLYKITITGRVQGVGFRWNALREASSLGLTGFVRNMTDGSVYIEAEGRREVLELFAEWCKTGPPHAHVKSIDVISTLPEGYNEFVISR
ncbi:MAG TPA: acylphosphatase [Bacteroidales bacterium]|nr:acylphosphatase [Bacteroidales bacterium]